ncbi:MAG: HsdR family type I site-specific deoxyribonuclease [Candidatus Thiodiazotropha sp.]
MFQDEEQKVELPAIEQLQSLGWNYIHGSSLSPETSDEREYFKDVVLTNRLTEAVQRINPWINDANLRAVVRELTHLKVATLMEANQSVWEKLVSYQSVIQDLGKGNKGQTVKVIDFDNPENNEFLCTNQFKIEGPNQNIIPDIVLFVNGLPLAVIECKSPYITNPMESGIDQLLRYANQRQPHEDEGAEKLFHYNQLMVSTHRDKARVGTISSRMEHYLEWKDPYPQQPTDINSDPNSQEILIAGLFNKQNFLDLIQNFTVYEPIDGKTIKKIARYQQYRAVHKTIERIKTGENRKDRGGVIWHTQGSGKSLTMVFLAVKMRRDEELKEYKLVFITDRTQLDQQLTSTFQKAQGETVYHAKSVTHLKELLQKDSSDLVTAMMQKFQEGENDFDFPVLNESEKIIVLADEAHRTQYGTLGVAINTGLPNAPKIAFTGTPLIKTQKTNNEFGTYIDTYTIEQAVQDGATVQILYEGREAQTKVTGDSLDSLFNEYFKDRSDEEKSATLKKYGNIQAVLEAPQRIKWVCIDLLNHYKEHIQPNGFKAMIVTSSRKAAVLFKEMLDEIGAPPSECIISGSHNDSAFFSKYTDSTKQKQAIENFKKPISEHPLSFLVVKDMLLTGFDAPICQVMYLDRKLQEHTLLQAIARVNRTYANKPRGFIVDYYGLSDYLTEALEMFSTEDVAGALKDLKDEIPKLKAAHTRVMQHFKGMDVTDTDSCILSLEDLDKRQQFEIDFKRFAKQMDIIMPNEAAKPFLSDLKFLGKINLGARNLFRDSQLNLAGVGEKVRQLIDENIRATGVDPKIPPVELFDTKFKDKVQEHKSDRAKASDIEHAIKHHITVNLDDDPEYYKSLAEKLKGIIEKHKEHWEELVQLLLEFREEIDQGPILPDDVKPEEGPFYHILVAEVARVTGNESLDESTHDEIVKITKELVQMLDDATRIVDFFSNSTEVKTAKKNIKRRILETSFDDADLRQAVIDRFMELAKVKFE